MKHNRAKPLTDDQARRLLAAADNAEQEGTAVYLGLYAALRRREIAQLRWENIDLASQTLTIHRSKRDEPQHRMPLHPRLVARLESRHGGDGWVFPDQHGGHVAEEVINGWVTDVAAAADVDGVHVHRLRGTCAARLHAALQDPTATADALDVALAAFDYGDAA